MNLRYGVLSLTIVFLSFFSQALFADERIHVVRAGDTIFSLARSFNVSQEELMRLNGITDPSRLRVGQQLRIPGTSTASATAAAPSTNSTSADVYHRTARGETFYGIARTYGVAVNDILRANNLSSNYVLREGDVLRIPGAGTTVAQATAASSSTTTPSTAASPTTTTSGTGSNSPAVTRTDTRATESATLDASVRWPITARNLSYMIGSSNGVIITGEASEPVKSLTNGTVISAGPYRGYGRVAIVQAANGYTYVYGGCESLTVKEGDKVGPGMEMGRLGIDPITGMPQLFFRVYLNNTPIDPAKAPRA
jgi:murein DD-endopeptidase MepM/ murein hydrolase activator NlpD